MTNIIWYTVMKNSAMASDVTNDLSTGDIIFASVLCGIMLASIIGIGIYLSKKAKEEKDIK